MTTDPTKALPDTLRRTFQRVLGRLSALPRRRQVEDMNQRQIRELQQQAQQKVERYRKEFNTRTADIAEQFARQELTSREFRALFMIELRYLLYTGAAAGAGGVGNMTTEDISRVDAKLKEQARYLDNWIAQAERMQTRSPQQFKIRAQMYGGSGANIASQTIDRSQFREFPNLPFYPKDRTRCKQNCLCRWEWTKVDREKGNADVRWRLAFAEHCPTCIARAEACNPLMIRNFQIVNMPANMHELLAE